MKHMDETTEQEWEHLALWDIEQEQWNELTVTEQIILLYTGASRQRHALATQHTSTPPRSDVVGYGDHAALLTPPEAFWPEPPPEDEVWL